MVEARKKQLVLMFEAKRKKIEILKKEMEDIKNELQNITPRGKTIIIGKHKVFHSWNKRTSISVKRAREVLDTATFNKIAKVSRTKVWKFT